MSIDLEQYSQAGQDWFALSVVSENNTYIEIGANHFRKNNNTYRLEVDHRWRGFSVELNRNKFESIWNNQTERSNKIYWDDAITFDYLDAVNEIASSKRIGYLSCDIEPPVNTFRAMKKVIDDGITFDCITFEHDRYRSERHYDTAARRFLKSKGYQVAVENVFPRNRRRNVFETWFVNNDVAFGKMDFSAWREQQLSSKPELKRFTSRM